MAARSWAVSFRPRRRYQAAGRWLTDTDRFTSHPAKALVVQNPEAAAERLQVLPNQAVGQSESDDTKTFQINETPIRPVQGVAA
jgi:hypothetical protein